MKIISFKYIYCIIIELLAFVNHSSFNEYHPCLLYKFPHYVDYPG